MTTIWLASRPLLLASKSQARRSLLAAAGIPFEAMDAQIDEREIEAPLRETGAEGAAIAARLAREKAVTISALQPERLVLGADQTLSLKRWPLEGNHLSDKPSLSFQGDRASDRTQKSATFVSDALGETLLTKPVDLAGAKAQLAEMSGRIHTLSAALCLARDGKVVAEGVATAQLTCRQLSPAYIDDYLDLAGESVLQSVGAYAVEGLGIHLFDAIEGEHSTILGLPMLPLLRMLRKLGCVAT